MPMAYVYTCPVCGTSVNDVPTLPSTWIQIVRNGETGELPVNEYCDKWECVETFAHDKTPTPTA